MKLVVSINRILIIGLGSIGNRHLRLARQLLPQADIRILRHQLGSPVPVTANGVFFHMDEAIAFAPHIAVIASPAPFHIATAQTLAKVGVHLLIEKPLSSSLSGVKELLELSSHQGIVVQTGYNLRFLPSLKRFRELLGQGVVGQVLSVRCEIGQYLPSWRPDSDYRLGVSAQRQLGGGALLELSHELDYMRWIFGEVDWVKATLCRQSRLDIDVEDTVYLTLGFAPKADALPIIATLNMDFIRHDTTRLCVAIGENGSLRWNGLTGEIALYEMEATQWAELYSHPHQRDDSYLAEWQNFIDCVTEHKIPLVKGEDGLKVLEIIEAARISATSGQQVSVAALFKADGAQK